MMAFKWKLHEGPCNLILTLESKEMAFRTAADEFLRVCAVERRLSAHTILAYAADLADFGRWLEAGTGLPDISATTLKEYLAAITGERKLAVATVRRRFACLRVFFRYTADAGIAPDPFASWRPKHPQRKRLPRALSRMEISSLLLSLKCKEQFADVDREGNLPIAVRLMVVTGIRVGELCKLQIDDLSPDGSALRIHGKGSRDRVVYVTDPGLAGELCDLVRRRRRGGNSCRALFVNRHRAAIRTQTVRTKLRRYAAELGLTRRVTPHMLRHTAATLLIETGVDIRFVQRLLGHASIATTEIYTHISDEALRSTLQRADVLAGLA
jgi:site-specific recombinase XerD